MNPHDRHLKREKLTVSLPASDAAFVERIAKAQDTTRANVLRFAVALLHMEEGTMSKLMLPAIPHPDDDLDWERERRYVG